MPRKQRGDEISRSTPGFPWTGEHLQRSERIRLVDVADMVSMAGAAGDDASQASLNRVMS
ncbi:hypothetical protein CH75_23805 [Dyella jiangningensis]|nr:hypothetical protein CH75_00725 [Dyella jiangningensis]AHX16488.1 hypothetical protein CH75_23805 [Dyella jiangningensis]